jgi:hypothetical protein
MGLVYSHSAQDAAAAANATAFNATAANGTTVLRRAPALFYLVDR